MIMIKKKQKKKRRKAYFPHGLSLNITLFPRVHVGVDKNTEERCQVFSKRGEVMGNMEYYCHDYSDKKKSAYN